MGVAHIFTGKIKLLKKFVIGGPWIVCDGAKGMFWTLSKSSDKNLGRLVKLECYSISYLELFDQKERHFGALREEN